MLRKISFVCAALAIGLSTAHAQNTASPAKPVEGAAKSCYFERGPVGDVLVGRGGLACGKGSSVTFRMYQKTEFLVEQICDLALPVRRSPGGDAPPDDIVGCIFTGEIADPGRTFYGRNVSIAPARGQPQQ